MPYIYLSLVLTLLYGVYIISDYDPQSNAQVWDFGYLQPQVEITTQSFQVRSFGVIRMSCDVDKVRHVVLSPGGRKGLLLVVTNDFVEKVYVPFDDADTASMVFEINEYVTELAKQRKAAHANTQETDSTFDTWLAGVDHHLIMSVGLGVEDLPDPDYRRFYDEGLTAGEVLDIIEGDL